MFIKEQMSIMNYTYKKNGSRSWDFNINGYKKGNQIEFVCPFCYEKYNSNGLPRSNSKRVKHRSGYVSELSEGKGYRFTPHCKDEAKKMFGLKTKPYDFIVYDNVEQLPDNIETLDFIINFD